MDDVNAFFDFSKDFERKPAMRGTISGNTAALVTASLDSKPQKRERLGMDYAQKELENMQQRMDSMPDYAMHEPTRGMGFSGMETLEDLSESEMDETDHRQHLNAEIYKNYRFDTNRDSDLPIHDTRQQILDAIRKNYVTILEGDTGCGKTTQVPQYLLDDAYMRNEYCNIICTQPRRIAAMSIARRVCSERNWETGSLVGYQVGLHANQSDDTRLLYCTTGVLLQKLIAEKTMERYTHVILDEVHERDQDMDFLLIVVRNLLTTVSRKVKIILMSATINTGEFAAYFKIRNNPAPVIRVDTRRQFVVREFYLDDLSRINNMAMSFDEPVIPTDMYHLAVKLIVVIDNIETQEIMNLPSPKQSTSNSILIFLPGIHEIDELANRLEELNTFKRSRLLVYVIRLHSLVSPDEQSKVFNHSPAGYRKVILATNIAESSITVPDVKYVIDFCLTKNLFTDTATNFTTLQLQWASKANCRQRSGRAGRVMSGRVYRLVPRRFYETQLDDFNVPEMLRAPLESVVLKAKLLDMGPPSTVLALAMNPPNLTDIRNTIMMLKEIGALYPYVNGIFSLQDGDLSFTGRVMAQLPLDCRLTRLILLGYVFSCLEEAIIIAAGLSVRSICRTMERGQINAFVQKMVWADGSGSDLFALLKVYKLWSSMREQHNMSEQQGESTWARRYFINLRALKEMSLLVDELKSRLDVFGIKEQNYNRVNWNGRERVIILKVIISGAFYPNYFVRGGLNEMDRERAMYHTLCGNDPANTVYLTNFDSRHIGQVYVPAIKKLLQDGGISSKNVEIRFQPGSERVFVTFRADTEEEETQRSSRLVVPGHVRPEIYKAVRMRFARMPMSIRLMDPREELRFATRNNLGVMVEGVWRPHRATLYDRDLVVLPHLFQNVVRGRVTHIEHCSKFYFQPLLQMEKLLELKNRIKEIESDERAKFRNPSDVGIGMVLAAPLGDEYQRAKVIKPVITSTGLRKIQFKVFYIDFGDTLIVNFEDLRCLNEYRDYAYNLPPRVFECRLANIQPSSLKSPHGKWHEDANELLANLTLSGLLDLHIYSVVHNVANVIVMESEHVKLNDTLVFKGYASKTEENYMSKSDHDLRWRKQAVTIRSNDAEKTKQVTEYFRSISNDPDVEGPPPPEQLLIQSHELRGPFSPLEVNMYSAIRSGQWKTVKIEPDSVNFALIDTDPQDNHERLIVAACVTESKVRDNITARSTTLMPNIHGFPALMTMLFAPRMQLKTDENRTKYVSVLAGLGWNPKTGEALFEEHDIVLNLDVELGNDDVELVNQLRYSMDTMVYCEPGHEQRLGVARNVSDDLAVRVKTLIIKLLNKNRKYIENHTSATDFEWDHKSEDAYERDGPESRRIFPSHSAHTLYDEKYDQKHALGVHCLELHRMRQFDGTVDALKCQLCNQHLENIAQLRIHLLSQLHCDRESQIGFKIPNRL